MKLAIIGIGNIGDYTARALAPKVEKVNLCTSRPEEVKKQFPEEKYFVTSNARETVKDADFVIFCDKTEKVYDRMLDILPYCKKGAIISGQTSRKTPEAQAFDEYFSSHPDCGLEYVSIHTMCNPRKSQASKEILGIIRQNSSETAYNKAKEFYQDMSEHIEEFESVEEHDTRAANTQINTSRTFLSIASAFARVGCFPWANETYSSAFDKMKFSLAMRAAKLEAHIYRGIQFGSEYGKDLVRHAIEVESELYGMIVGNKRKQYMARVLAAKKKLFGSGKLEPILDDEAMSQFGNLVINDPNSHFSIIQWAVDAAENGRDIFEDLKATTPMYTSLVCLTDRLFTAEDGRALERAIVAPFDNPQLRTDDLDFHDEIQGWSSALLYDNVAAYNSRHELMRARIDKKHLDEEVEKSILVIDFGREALAKRLKVA
ncbi:NAD(P)-binding domain-containing protein [Candidatus Woesearchaeota archaeon]|nr:NAD(P)-binding domain-containing protein [Candidatus Woesearchaeota archaeon]